MGAAGLSSRAIIGSFYQRLSELGQAAWVNKVGMLWAKTSIDAVYKLVVTTSSGVTESTTQVTVSQ